MPNIGELAAQLVGALTGAIGASSMRLGAVPTVAVLLIVLVLLSLIARPRSRWSGSDLGRLAGLRRAMALAAEAGADATVSLGSTGIARGAAAHDRFQTLATLPLLGEVAAAAARAGVPLRVTTNDPVAAMLAEATVAAAHDRTSTAERAGASSVEYLGEGRSTAAAAALSGAARHGVAVVAGGLAEESLMLLDGVLAAGDWSVAGSASAGEAAGPLLLAGGSLVGPELLQAMAEVSASGHARTAVEAANRLMRTIIALLILGSVAAWAGWPQVANFLAGR
jgi:hypothetical protein